MHSDVFQENINLGDLSQQLVDLVVASACVATMWTGRQTAVVFSLYVL